MEPFCLNAKPYDKGKQRSQIPGITVCLIYGDVQAFELGAKGLLRVGFAVDEAHMFWSFAHAFDKIDQVLLVGVG